MNRKKIDEKDANNQALIALAYIAIFKLMKFKNEIISNGKVDISIRNKAPYGINIESVLNRLAGLALPGVKGKPFTESVALLEDWLNNNTFKNNNKIKF
jgi:hypothetical protein